MSKKVIIIIAVAVVLAIVAGGGVAFFLLKGSGEEKPKEVFYYSPGEYFVTNMKDSSSGLVKVTVTVGYTEKGAETEFTAKNAVIRNAIVFTLRSKTKEEMKSPDIEAKLSDEMKTRLNQELGIEHITKIYFSDFVIQG